MSVKLRKKGNVLVTKLVTDCMDHHFVYNMNCFHIEKKKYHVLNGSDAPNELRGRGNIVQSYDNKLKESMKVYDMIYINVEGKSLQRGIIMKNLNE